MPGNKNSSKKLSGLPYLGGKNVYSHAGTGAWIVEMLPDVVPNQTYVEPFSGMLGVMLQRGQAECEIANDLSGVLINWWEVARDHNEELAHKVEWTPNSRAVYEEALTKVESEDSLESAWACSVVLLQSLVSALYLNSQAWRLRRIGNGINTSVAANRIRMLRERIQTIQFESRDAIDVLRGVTKYDHTVIYCDPPYGGRNTEWGLYEDNNTRYESLLETFTDESTKARIAVSGYPGDWDELETHGWYRHEKPITSTAGIRPGNRVEVLWTNYVPNSQLQLELQ